MSLKTRLAATLSAAFVAILIIGGLLTYDQATKNVAAELSAARSVAANRVAQLVAKLPASRDTAAELASFVRAFNGDRHVQVLLIDSTGAVRDFSTPAKDYGALPDWFVRLLAPDTSTTVMPLSGAALPMTAVAVSIDPRNEIATSWTDLGLGLGSLVLFVLLAFAAIWVVADRALRPLGAIQAAFARIGAGDYASRVAPSGPPEMRVLATRCNEMAVRLAEISARNRRLSEQLLRLQDEERAELARDLHDDIGPLLFAIDVDASAIARLARSADDKVTGRAEAIKTAAHRARQEVRRILSDLRPGLTPGLGLKAAIEELIAELSRRHGDVAFSAELAEGDWGGPLEVLVHRAVREGLNNALRHSAPTRVAVRVAPGENHLAFSVVDDGGGLAEPGTEGGFGLLGMRERVEAAGGELTMSQVPFPPGVRLEGRVPLPRDSAPPGAVVSGMGGDAA
ncbi:histidine kinase [Aurantimonas sp. E1-2-R+4]|uniref:sensor histidine kinase n=1 Tax=Aurantimonas sp. E1-2-R+4 TaxID=3113714 RepID=UPI002F95C5D3